MTSPPAVPPRRPGRARLLAFALLPSLLAAALAEAALRLADPQVFRFVHAARQVHRYDPRYRIDLVPSASARLALLRDDGTPLFDFVLAADPLGLRSPEPTLRPEARGRRVVHCLGDSMTMGWGIPADQAWPAHLGRALGPDSLVLNLGVDGFGLRAARRKSEAVREAGLAPAALVYLFVANDPEDDARLASVEARPWPLHLAASALDRARQVSYLVNLPFAVKWYRDFRPALRARLATGTPSPPATPGPPSPMALAAVAASPTMAELEELAADCRGRGEPLLVAGCSTEPLELAFLAQARAMGLPVLHSPLGPEVRIPGDGHLTGEGSRRLAEAVAAALTDRRWSSSPP